MKPNKTSKLLKYITLGAAAAGCALRFAHYALGTDGRGLLVRNHWTVYGLWVLCLGFCAALLILRGSITGSRRFDHARFTPIPAAAGSLALGAALLITAFRNFGGFLLSADFLIWVLGPCAGLGLIAAGICRLSGKKPYFLMHALLCLYMALRMVSMYRQWSADPQLQDYGFYITAHAAVMLTAYQHAAFDAAMGSHRNLWVCSLASVFLSCTALPHCEEWILMAACALWAFCNLTVLPVRGRRVRGVPQQEAESAEG